MAETSTSKSATSAPRQSEGTENADPSKAEQQKQAEKDLEEAKKNALDKDGKNKTNDEGQVIGLDGENPVSATNPDPNAVRGAYVL